MKHKYFRIISLTAAVVLSFVLFAPSAYEIFHLKHICIGSRCNICESIKRCEKMMSTAGIDTSSYTGVSYPCGSIELTCLPEPVITLNTLITLKVELLD